MSEYDKQADDFLTKYSTSIKRTYVGFKKYFEDDKEPRDVWNVVVTRGDRDMSFTFGNSIAESKRHTTPSNYDILATLSAESYDPGSFENFVYEFGYEAATLRNMRQVQKTYDECVRQYQDIRRVFGNAVHALREIA